MAPNLKSFFVSTRPCFPAAVFQCGGTSYSANASTLDLATLPLEPTAERPNFRRGAIDLAAVVRETLPQRWRLHGAGRRL